MGLSAGHRLGPFEIVAPLGAGGMGEVYKARDTRLERIVAIKVLPSHLSDNPDLKQRFEREAKAISSLNHPHICTLHDIGHHDGTDFLVMEFLEGETLADRLRRGALPLAHVLSVGMEIADALDKAHRQGLVHRDLKPGNIMLTKSGAKLMDFGLAKGSSFAIAASSAGPLTPSTPTMSVAALSAPASPLTQKGTVVGTFQYLAPEVLQGFEADARSDLFAFGCVLYEMATGRPAFQGKSQLSVLTAILEKDPEPVRTIVASAPRSLDQIVSACLAKDPAERIQSAHDVRLQLQFVREAGADPAAIPTSSKRFSVAALAVLSGLLLVAVAALAFFALPNQRPMPVLHTSILPPENSTFDTTGDFSAPPVLSPDGKLLVFGVQSQNGGRRLWLRSLDSDKARPLDGTDGAIFPFWSPDSRVIAFFADGKLKKLPIDGGPITEVAAAPNGRGGSWGSKGIILFAPDFRTGLMQVSANGGEVTPATSVDSSLHTTHRWPVFLPDGKHFIFFANNHSGGLAEKNGIYFASLGETGVHEIVASDAGALFCSGYLLFHLGDRMMAQAMDQNSGKLTGNAFQVVESVTTDVSVWRMLATGSETGLLVYRSGTGQGGKVNLAWFDRSGKLLNTIGGPGVYREPRLSPDGRHLAVAEFVDNQNQIYTVDLARGLKTRVTFDNAAHIAPAWSPDGKTIAYSAVMGTAQAGWTIYEKDVQSGSPPKLVVPFTPETTGNNGEPDWVAGGKYLLYHAAKGPTGAHIMAMPLMGDAKPFTVLAPQSPNGNIQNYRLSPDGKWIAFECSDGGQLDIYVSAFPSTGTRTQVSSGGGLYPVWRPDGKELYYIDSRNLMMMAVPVTSNGSEFQFGNPQPLFRAQTSATGSFVYDVTRDGKRFMITSAPPMANVPLTLVTNWTAELKK